jgi:hypothetical protein
VHALLPEGHLGQEQRAPARAEPVLDETDQIRFDLLLVPLRTGEQPLRTVGPPFAGIGGKVPAGGP